jgi:hypothetical protein
MKRFTQALATAFILLAYLQTQAQLTVDAGPSQTICTGFSAQLTANVSGGTPPYLYQWAPASNLSNPVIHNPLAGPTVTTTYSVTVTDNLSATATDTVTVYVNNLQIGQPTAVDASCANVFDGSITINSTGGFSPYTYTLNGGPSQPSNIFNGLGDGTYTAEVIDAQGCSSSTPVFIDTTYSVSTSINSLTNVSCFSGSDGSATIQLNGGILPIVYNINGVTWWPTGTFSNLSAGNYNLEGMDSKGCRSSVPLTIGQPTQIQAQTIVTNVTCNGGNNGSINLTVTGGTPAYVYNWSNASTTQIQSNLSAGTYTVTITDNHGCTVTASDMVSQPTQIQAQTVVTNISCNGANNGSIDLVVTGGTPGYTYNWSNGSQTQDQSNCSANPYAVTVQDSHLCSASAAATVSQPTAVQIQFTQVIDVTCFGLQDGAINVTVSGGSGPYSFLWSTFNSSEDISGLGGGTYHVIVTDASGCSRSDSAIVNEPPQLYTTAVVHNVTCNGDNDGYIDVTAYGGTLPYTFLWNNSTTTEDEPTLSGGTYVVTITDLNGCTAASLYVVNEPAPIQLSFTMIPVACNGAQSGSLSVTPTGGVTPYTYLWSNFSTDSNLTNIASGVYHFLLTDSNGCQKQDSFTVTEPTAIQINTFVTNAVCYATSTGTISVTTFGGTPGYTYSWSNGATGTGITGLAVGNYALTVSDANNCTAESYPTVMEPPQLALQLTSATGSLPDTLCIDAIGGTGAYNYVWSTGNTTSCINIVSAGNYIATVTDANGCSATVTSLMPCPNECVWPGDANYDGIVDNDDLLPIGLAYGTTGPQRPSQDISWSPHVASTWATTVFVDSTYKNAKHSDCNGNGIINADDSLAIVQNYSLIHAKTDSQVPWRNNIPALQVDLAPDTTHAGDTMYAYISLGDLANTATDVYGISFTLNYEVDVVDTNQTHAVFGDSWLGTASDKISIATDLKQGQMECALTRIDHTARSGSGEIGYVSFVITTDNINGKTYAYHNLHVWLSNVIMIDNIGNYLMVNEGQDSSLVEYEPTGIAETEKQIDFAMLPNPAGNQLAVYNIPYNVTTVQVTDLAGRVLTTQPVLGQRRLTLDVSGFAEGFYIIQVRSAKTMRAKQLIIAR